MRAVAAIACGAALAPAVAGACTAVQPTRAEVWQGEACARRYSDPRSDISAGEVVDLGHGIVRQRFATGACDRGDRLVAYFDCGMKTGAWLGGPAGGPDAPPVPVVDGVPVVDPGGYSISDAFVAREEKRLANGPRPADVLIRIRAMSVPAQSGVIESPRMTVDGRRFDLNCGCKLFYPNGVN